MAIVDEGFGHAFDVSGTGVAGDQPLDQLFGNEAWRVGVHEQSIQGDAQAVGARGACRDHCAQKAFRFRAVQTGVQGHGQALTVSQRRQRA